MQIAVLIPHHNNLLGLKKSLESLSSETLPLKIVIVDDHSNSVPKDEDFESLLIPKHELHLVSNKEQAGIEHALNAGLRFIKQNLPEIDVIARLDCGDRNINGRLSKQVQFLNSNPNVCLVGSYARLVNSKGIEVGILKHPLDQQEIIKYLYINSPFVHPSICFRTKLLDFVPLYPTTYKFAEDHAFFFAISKFRDVRMANLPEQLLEYEISADSISSTRRKQQIRSRILLIWDNFYFGFLPIYSILRNMLLLLLSRNFSLLLRKTFYRK